MITLDQAKAHLNVTTEVDDVLIQSQLDAAKQWVAGHIGTDSVDTDDTPAPVREAVLALTAHWYANREAQELPSGLIDMLVNSRRWSF